VLIVEISDFNKSFDENDKRILEEEMYERFESAATMDTLYH